MNLDLDLFACSVCMKWVCNHEQTCPKTNCKHCALPVEEKDGVKCTKKRGCKHCAAIQIDVEPCIICANPAIIGYKPMCKEHMYELSQLNAIFKMKTWKILFNNDKAAEMMYHLAHGIRYADWGERHS